MTLPSHEAEELLARWQAGDLTALAPLLGELRPWLQQEVRSRLGQGLRRAADSDDLVQDTFLGLLGYTPRTPVRTLPQLRALLSAIVRNAIHARARHQAGGPRARQAHPLASDAILRAVALPSGHTPPEERASGSEERQRLRLALDLLPPADRELLHQRFYERLPWTDIAHSTGLPEPTLRKRLPRALQRLATLLETLRTPPAQGPPPGP